MNAIIPLLFTLICLGFLFNNKKISSLLIKTTKQYISLGSLPKWQETASHVAVIFVFSISVIAGVLITIIELFNH